MFLVAQFRYTADQRKKIDRLRSLVRANKLPVGTEDIFLSKFLHFAKWQVSKAYNAIVQYYDFKDNHPDWIAHHEVAYFRDLLFTTKSRFIMPNLDKNGRVVAVCKSVDFLKKFCVDDLIEMDDIILEGLLLVPAVQKNGLSLIWDNSGMFSPSTTRLMNQKFEILPISNLTIHIIQKGFFINASTSLIMPFLSKELKEKIVMHDAKNLTKLQDMIGYDALPFEYGGSMKNVPNIDILYNHLATHAEYLKHIQKYTKKCTK